MAKAVLDAMIVKSQVARPGAHLQIRRQSEEASLAGARAMSAQQTPAVALPAKHIASRILAIRGQRVIIDADLAALYGVTTKWLNEQVRRNSERFPADFMFQLTNQEVATSSSDPKRLAWGGRRYAPFAFTEHGAIMVATVLNSPRAVEVSSNVVRAFVSLRELLTGHNELARRLDELEERLTRKLATHARAIAGILVAIRQLMAPPPPEKKRPIGFITPPENPPKP